MAAPGTTVDAPPGGAPALVHRKASPMRRKENAAAYTFVAPFVVVFVAMLVVPLGYAFYTSLFKSQLIGGTQFAWFANYARALSDSSFLRGIGRMAIILVVQVPVMLGLALVFALLLDSGVLYLRRFLRLGIFIPYAVPSVVAALMWGYLYGKDFGPFAQFARRVGAEPIPFLSADWVLFSIMNVITWLYIGYNMIVMYAALRAVPSEIYDAAAVDGASRLRIAWSIKIPAIRPAIMLTAIFSVIGTFQLFTEPSVLQPLAPNVILDNYTPNLYAFNLAFVQRDLNYAAALAFLLGLVIMIVSYVVQLSGQRRGGER